MGASNDLNTLDVPSCAFKHSAELNLSCIGRQVPAENRAPISIISFHERTPARGCFGRWIPLNTKFLAVAPTLISVVPAIHARFTRGYILLAPRESKLIKWLGDKLRPDALEADVSKNNPSGSGGTAMMDVLGAGRETAPTEETRPGHRDQSPMLLE